MKHDRYFFAKTEKIRSSKYCNMSRQARYKAYLDNEEKNSETVKVFRDDNWQNGRGMLISLLKDESKNTKSRILLARAMGDSPSCVFETFEIAEEVFDRAVNAYQQHDINAAWRVIAEESLSEE